MMLLEAELDLVYTIINIACVFIYIKLIVYWITMDGIKRQTEYQPQAIKVLDPVWYDEETENYHVSKASVSNSY